MTNTNETTRRLTQRVERAEAAMHAAWRMLEHAEARGDTSWPPLEQATNAALEWHRARCALGAHLAGEAPEPPMTPADELAAVRAILDEFEIDDELRAAVVRRVELEQATEAATRG